VTPRRSDEPVRLTRIYTRGGDRGETSLGDGARVSKLDPLVRAYGEVDELNSLLGWALLEAGDPRLARIQNELFDLGADLSVPFTPDDGKLRVAKPLGLRTTFHDPCHLGRFNKGYEAPRDVLKLLGCELVEMGRSRANSFCCGAGGGRIWIPDPVGSEKPAQNRIKEAAAIPDLQVYVVSCPKDLTMFEDALKTTGNEGKFVVKELIELIREAIPARLPEVTAV